MIISIFKKNYFFQLVLLVVLPLILWLPAFINPPQIITLGAMDMPLYNAMASGLSPYRELCTILAFVIMALGALALNYIFVYYELTRKNSYFPAFVYMLLFSCDYRLMTISSVLFANTIMIVAIKMFLQCYNKNEGLDQIFLTAFLGALSSLFFAPYILFMIWIWVGLLNFKIYKWRPIIVSILGMILPYLILMIIYYLENRLDLVISFFPQHFAVIPDTNVMTQPIQVVYMAYMLILVVAAVYFVLNYKNNQKLSVRKRISTMVLLLVFSLLPFAYCLATPVMSLVFAPSVAFVLTIFFFSIKRELYSTLFFSVWLVLTIAKIYINY